MVWKNLKVILQASKLFWGATKATLLVFKSKGHTQSISGRHRSSSSHLLISGLYFMKVLQLPYYKKIKKKKIIIKESVFWLSELRN